KSSKIYSHYCLLIKLILTVSKISISVYKISINKRGKPEEKEDLDDFANGNDLLELVKGLPAQFRKINWNSTVIDGQGTNRRTIIPKDNFDVSGRIISGYVSSGDYGYETPIADPEGNIIARIAKEN